MTATVLAAGFAAPGLAIAGLVAMALPVLIHLLLRRRRRPIEWAAMDLLRRAIERRRRQLRLERWLLLAIRMAALGLLGAALARPYLEGAETGSGSRTVWIVLDDGVSSRVEDGDGRTAFEGVATRTNAWISKRPVGDDIGVILASHPARILIEPTADHRRVSERIESTIPSLAGTDLDAAIALVASRLAANPTIDPIVLVASDLRLGSLEPPRSNSTSGVSALAAMDGLDRLALPPGVEPIDNVAVVSLAPGRPPVGGGLAPVRIELARQGDASPSTTRVSLSGPRLATAIERDVRWRSGERTASVELQVPMPLVAPGEDPDVLVEVSIEPDAQAADDRRFGLLDARPRLRVGVAADDRDLEGWFARALSPSTETPIELVPIEPALLDGSSLRTIEAMVVARPDLVPASAWSDLARMIDRGGVVIVAPPSVGGGIAWLDRLAEIVPERSWSFGAGPIDVPDGPGRRIDAATPHAAWMGMIAAEFEDLAAPVSIGRRLEIGDGVPESEIVVRSLDGAPLVIAATAPSGGSIALFMVALDLDWSDLPVRPLMVPLVQELLREGIDRSRIRTVGTVGDDRFRGLVEATAIETPSGGRIEMRQGVLERPVDETGRLSVVDVSGSRIGGLVVNIEASAASTEPVDREVVATRLGEGGPWRFTDDLDSDDSVAAGESGDTSISTSMLVGVIVLLLLEALLARRFSRTSTMGDSAEPAPAFLAAYGVGDGGRRTTNPSMERTS